MLPRLQQLASLLTAFLVLFVCAFDVQAWCPLSLHFNRLAKLHTPGRLSRTTGRIAPPLSLSRLDRLPFLVLNETSPALQPNGLLVAGETLVLNNNEDDEDNEDEAVIGFFETTPSLEALRRELMDATTEPQEIEVGMLVTGIVAEELSDRGIFVESDGRRFFLPLKEMASSPSSSLSALHSPPSDSDETKEAQSALCIGELITAEVVGFHRTIPILSQRVAELRPVWSELRLRKLRNEAVTVTVMEKFSGGVVCSYKGVRGFIALSHLSGSLEDVHVGDSLHALVSHCIEATGKLTLSPKRFSSSLKKALIRHQLVNCTVTGFQTYGVFIETDSGINGLIHGSKISQIPEVEHMAAEIFSLGQKIVAVVTSHAQRLAVSTQELERFPGELLSKENHADLFAHAAETWSAVCEKIRSATQNDNIDALPTTAPDTTAVDNIDMMTTDDSMDTITTYNIEPLP
jgi:predicted RNA-binding protein with RPS1 domain